MAEVWKASKAKVNMDEIGRIANKTSDSKERECAESEEDYPDDGDDEGSCSDEDFDRHYAFNRSHEIGY